MLNKVTKIFLGSLTLTSLLLETNFTVAQGIEGSVSEDDLNTVNGVPWNGKNYAYSKVLDIKDSLVNTPVGRIVLDRHSQGGTDLFGSSPRPGRTVYISGWGSKIEGCFAELIIQYAPKDNFDPSGIAPTVIEIGAGDKIVRLLPQNRPAKIWTTNYTYEESTFDGTRTVSVTKNGTWYMGRQLFIVDAEQAEILSQTPNKKTNARITFNNGNTLIFPIGAGTVSRWKQAYGFNPTCQPP